MEDNPGFLQRWLKAHTGISHAIRKMQQELSPSEHKILKLKSAKVHKLINVSFSFFFPLTKIILVQTEQKYICHRIKFNYSHPI